MIKLLGVLRRPQAAADRDQELMRRLAGLENRPNCYGLPADTALIRYAAMTPWGQKLFVVPFKPARCQPPPCTGTERACAARPPDEETVRLVSDTGGTPALNPYPPLNATPEQVATGPVVELASAGGSSHPLRELMLVPDGVSLVEFVFPRRTYPGGPTYRHVLKATVRVHDNVAAIEVDRADAGQVVTWLGPSGKRIRRFDLGAG